MTTGSQLAVTGKKEERLLYNANEERAPSWAVSALLGRAESMARYGGSEVAERLGRLGGWVGPRVPVRGLLGWSPFAGCGARLA